MIVDRRKDSYDELMMLSRDARLSRSRTSKWTTALVATAVVGSGIYVAASNQHAKNLTAETTTVQGQLNAKTEELRKANELIARLQAERDFDRRNQDWFRDAAIALSLGDDLIDAEKLHVAGERGVFRFRG